MRFGQPFHVKHLAVALLLAGCNQPDGQAKSLMWTDDPELGVRCYRWWTSHDNIACLYKSTLPGEEAIGGKVAPGE